MVYGQREDLPGDASMSCLLYDHSFTNFDVSLEGRLQAPPLNTSDGTHGTAQAKKLASANAIFHIVGSAHVGDAMRALHQARLSAEMEKNKEEQDRKKQAR